MTTPPFVFGVLLNKKTGIGYFNHINQLGDIIVAIDNEEINTEADLFKILESKQPGDEIAITAQR